MRAEGQFGATDSATDREITSGGRALRRSRNRRGRSFPLGARPDNGRQAKPRPSIRRLALRPTSDIPNAFEAIRGCGDILRTNRKKRPLLRNRRPFIACYSQG